MEGDGALGVAVVLEVTVAQDDGPRTDGSNRVDGVAHEHDRRAGGLQLAHALEALELEREIADGQHLVDQEHLWIDVDGGGEAEPHVHAARVELHRHIDEVLEFGERHDVIEALLDLRSAQPQEHSVEEHVLPAGHLPVEADADADEGCHPTPDAHRPLSRTGYGGKEAQHRRLPSPVPAEDPDRLPLRDGEVDVPQCPQLAALRLAEGEDRAKQHRLLLELHVALPNARHLDGGGGDGRLVDAAHSRSTKSRSRRRCTSMAVSVSATVDATDIATLGNHR